MILISNNSDRGTRRMPRRVPRGEGDDSPVGRGGGGVGGGIVSGPPRPWFWGRSEEEGERGVS